MSKTLGQVICSARKRKGLTIDDVGPMIGKSRSIVSIIERDRLKGGPDPETVVRLANCLQDRSILFTYLENNAAYRAVVPQVFTKLNNIRKDPAVILTRWAGEAREGVESAMILAEIFSNADPTRTPNYRNTLLANLEQIVDSARCSEILFVELIEAGVITEEDRIEIHERQQRKCVEKGHHREVAA